MAAIAFPPQPQFIWQIWTDSLGGQHKCLHQKMWASCVPACMAMIVRATLLSKQKYQEETARGALRSIIGPKNYEVFNHTGISMKYVPDAFGKAGINNAVYVTGVNVDGAFCAKYFSQDSPGIVGVDIVVANQSFRHAMMCKGALTNGNILLICPAYGPHEVAPGNVAGGFSLTDMFQVGAPTPAVATPTGTIVKLI